MRFDRSMWLTAIAVLTGFQGGCTPEPDFVIDGVPTPPTAVDTDLPQACEGALALSPGMATTLPFGLVQFDATGGSGAYQFVLDDPTVGEVDETTGAFVAAAEGGSIGTITLTDANCEGSATAEVEVLVPMTVVPERARLAPGTAFEPDIVDGSGVATCVLNDNASGASVAGCVYTAGSGTGRDQLRVTDSTTGQFVDVAIDVEDGAAFRVDGEGGVFLPVGGHWAPSPVAGSFEVELGTPTGPFTVTPGGVRADGAGDGSVLATDRFTGESVTIPLRGLAPVSPDLGRDGERSSQGVVIPLGDVNGDGYRDAALGFVESSIEAHYAGMVAVYAGGPDGLDPTPVQVFSGTTTFETFGRSLDAADVNGDGRIDLIIGSDRTDNGGTNTGGVFIHHGLPTGFFDPSPSRSLYGPIEFSRFGSSVAACDFDGDGLMDLAVGGADATDLATAIPADDQGAIFVFWGSTSGFTDRPDFEIYGALPDGAGGFTPTEDLNLGFSLAAADMDGDGDCDLAAGMPDLGLDGVSEDGLVYIFEGRPTEVLSRTPVRVYAGRAGHDGEFGRRVDLADVDGDGRADLLATAWKEDPNGSASGAAYLFAGPADLLDTPPDQAIQPDTALWIGRGTLQDDYFGADARLDDFDLDGQPDVMVAAHRAEDGLTGQGLVYGFTDLDFGAGALAHTRADADVQFGGETSFDRFGQGFAVIGDANADGISDLLTLAGYADQYGVEAGSVWFTDGLSAANTLLDLPGEPGGHEIGNDLAWLDTDADGIDDLLIGAPEAGVDGEGGNAGVLLRALGNADGTLQAPATWLGGHPSHSGSDRFGFAVSAAGDFDGDGFEDLAVLSRSDSRPSDLTGDSAYSQPVGCSTARSLAGALFVYRGGPTGIDTTPAFVWWGPEREGKVLQLTGGVDHDGDGFDDLLVASTDWGVGGGFAVIPGRAHSGDAIDVICDDPSVLAADMFDRLGYRIDTLGDVDGDGCGEFVLGATGEEIDSDYNNQGTVRVLWGHSGPGCPAGPEMSVMSVEHVGTGLGSGLSVGDADQDGIPDLAVGGAEHRVYFSELGAAWWVPGAYIAGLQRTPLPAAVLPDDNATSYDLLLPLSGLEDTHGLVGMEAAGLFGESVILVASPTHPGEQLFGVAVPQGGVGGTAWTGGIVFHRHDGDGIDAVPWLVLAGESAPHGLLGTRILAHPDGAPRLAIGAPTSSVGGVEVGAYYTVDLGL